MQYDNTNTGVLFKNNKKESEKHPDYKGQINIDGENKELAAWIKVSHKGTRFLSLKISEPFQKSERPQERQQPKKIDLSDVPF